MKISFIVPCYNEGDNITKFHETLRRVWDEAGFGDEYVPELLFVDDGSSDNSPELLMKLSGEDHHVKYTRFSRNFGKEAAIFCGLKQAMGDAVIVLDADLQHPPAVIPQMVEKWREGYDVVNGVKSDRGEESAPHRFFAGVFYFLMEKLTGFDLKGASDFKLLDRKVVDILTDLSERATFFRGLTCWVGFRSTSVFYEVENRSSGRSKWSLKSLFNYALSNITSFTYLPLKIIALVGIIVILIGLWLGIDALVSYIRGEAVGGYPSLVILITIATGGIMLSLGIIAIYIAKIYLEVKKRPRYIVEERR